MTIDELKSLLSRFHIKPSHKLGQNFLLSDKALEEIVNAAELKSTDTVLEIGPGLGVLTAKLGQGAGLVLAVEKDYKLVNALRKLFKGKKNIKIMQGDALFLDTHELRMGFENTNPSHSHVRKDSHFVSYKVVANIPYYITGKLLQNFLTSEFKPSLIVLLLQKEVAERMVALPGEMSILSVSVQFYAAAEIVSIVPRKDFYPSPEVDSAIIKLKILEKPKIDAEEKKFFRLVKIGFAGKRKQLHNNLSAGLGAGEDYKKILESIGLNPLCRAQDLSLEDWGKLYRQLNV